MSEGLRAGERAGVRGSVRLYVGLPRSFVSTLCNSTPAMWRRQTLESIQSYAAWALAFRPVSASRVASVAASSARKRRRFLPSDELVEAGFDTDGRCFTSDGRQLSCKDGVRGDPP